MYLHKEFIPFLVNKLILYLINNTYIKIRPINIRKISVNISLFLINLWFFNKNIDQELHQIMLKKNISLDRFIRIRKNMSNTWIHYENNNSMYFISLKLMSLILTSKYIDNVYVNNNILQNSIIKIIQNFLINQQNINCDEKKGSFKKGTLEWELIQSKLYFWIIYKKYTFND